MTDKPLFIKRFGFALFGSGSGDGVGRVFRVSVFASPNDVLSCADASPLMLSFVELLSAASEHTGRLENSFGGGGGADDLGEG